MGPFSPKYMEDGGLGDRLFLSHFYVIFPAREKLPLFTLFYLSVLIVWHFVSFE